MTDKERKAVPREPDPAMIDAGTVAWCRNNHGEPYDNELQEIWRAMFDAAPALATAPSGERKALEELVALIEKRRWTCTWKGSEDEPAVERAKAVLATAPAEPHKQLVENFEQLPTDKMIMAGHAVTLHGTESFNYIRAVWKAMVGALPARPAAPAAPPKDGEVPLAQKMFEGWQQESTAEYELLDLLEAAGLPADWHNFWWDDYDGSWEFGPVPVDFVMPQACLDVLWKAGFTRGWLNFADDTEIYYQQGKTSSNRHPGRHREREDGMEARRNKAKSAPPSGEVAALIERYRELSAKATPGPWRLIGDDAMDCDPHRQSGLARIDSLAPKVGKFPHWPALRLGEWPTTELIWWLLTNAETIFAALARLSAPVPRSQWDESAGLTWRHPAPDAAVPMVPSPHQSLTIGVAAPVPAQEWVPVGERLPQRNDWVMTWDGLNIWPAVADPVSQSFDRSVPKFDDDNARPVTHWMPLPPPPAVDK